MELGTLTPGELYKLCVNNGLETSQLGEWQNFGCIICRHPMESRDTQIKVICGCGSESVLKEIIQCPNCKNFHHVKCRKAAKCKDCTEMEKDEAWLEKQRKKNEEIIEQLEEDDEEKDDPNDSDYDPTAEVENEQFEMDSEPDIEK